MIVYDLAYSTDPEIKIKRQREIEEFKQQNKVLIAKNRALQDDEFKQKKLQEERRLLEEDERKQKDKQHKRLQEITEHEKQEEKQATTTRTYQTSNIQASKRQPEPKYQSVTSRTGYRDLSADDKKRFHSAAGYRPECVLNRAYEEAYSLCL